MRPGSFEGILAPILITSLLLIPVLATISSPGASAEEVTITQTVVFEYPDISKIGDFDVVSIEGCGFSPVSFSKQENLDNNELVKETSILPEAAPSALPQEPWQPYAYNAERIRNSNGSWTVRVYTSPKFFLDPSDNVWRRMRWYETENEYVVIVPYAENGIPARWIIEKSSGTVRAKTWDNLPIIAAQRVEVLILTSERWKQLDENVLGWSTPKVDNDCLWLKLTADLSLDGVRIGSLMLTYRIADTIKYAVRLESAKYSTYRVKWNTMCQGAYYITNEVKGEFKITGEIKSLLWSPFIAVFDPYVRLSFEDISPWRENYFDMSLLKEAIFVKRPEGSAVELTFGDFRLGAGENIELDPSTNFSPTIDTYVRSGTPNTSYNSADRFYVGARATVWGIFRSFLKFNISELPSNTIISANLWVSTYGSYGWPNVQARRVENDNWDGTITWNNQPTFGAVETSFLTDGGWDNYDITAWVDNQVKGDKIVSVCLKHHTENTSDDKSVSYVSSEYNGDDPYLEITYTGAVLSPIADAFTDLRDNPSGNYGFENWIGVNRATKTSGTWPWPSGLGEGTFIKFDISGIPANATVTSATFGAYAYQICYSTTCDAALRQFGTNWDENTITGMNAPWGTLGGIVSSTVRGSIPGWWTHSVDLSYVQSKLGGQIGFYYCYPGTAGGTHYGQYYRSREYGNTNYRPYLKITYNNPPTTPSLWGETRPYIGTEYEYSFSSTDPDGHQIRYHIEWGDDTENWTGFYASGEVANASHTWYLQTEFSVRAMAIDEFNMESDWATLVISVKTYDDANDTEVGVEWVNEYPDWIGDDLFASDDSAEWFYNILGEDLGWTRVFDWGDGQAWEGDFEKPSVGGWDYGYVDNVDFAFFCGHGSSSAFWFGVDMDGDDSYTYQVHYSEAEWGDKDLEWIVFDACKVLREDNVFTRWSSAFKGLHGMFGFHTTAYQYKTPLQQWMDGQRFAEHLRDGKTIGDSWVNATHDIQPSEVWGAAFCILDPTWSPPRWEFYESLPGHGWVGADVWPPLIQESNLLYYYRWQC